MGSEETRRVIDDLYDAYLAGNPAGILATFSDDIAFRFLGQVEGQGIDEARRFFAHSAGLLTDLDRRRSCRGDLDRDGSHHGRGSLEEPRCRCF